jgi:hypothetical protein
MWRLGAGEGKRRRQWAAQPAFALEPDGHGSQNRVCHRTQVAEGLVSVLAHVEIDLGDRVEAGQRVGVDQQADVDPVPGGERQRFE